MFKILLTTIFIVSFLNAEDPVSFIKEKKEIKELKKELNAFYNKKEADYKKRKTELNAILAKIEQEKKAIKELYEKNRKVLEDVEGAVSTKTSKIYNGMKPKVAADIFNQMVNDGKIEEVFDIILKLKEKKVTQILKFLDLESASMLTQMLHAYKTKKTKDDNG